MRSTLMVGAVFILIFGTPSWAASGVTGKWTIKVQGGIESSGGQRYSTTPPETVVLDLQTDGTVLTGTVTSFRTGARRITTTKAIAHGKVDGNKASFDVPTELLGTPLTTHYDGMLVGDIIYFTIKTGGGRSSPKAIEAHRLQATEEAPAAGSVASPGTPSAMTLDSGLKLATLNHGDIERLGGNETRLDLFLLKYTTSLFDDQRIMRYFIVLNNCGGQRSGIEQAFNSEFDYPKMVTFYRTNAPEILEDVPRTVSIRVSAFPNISHNRIVSPIAAVLGDYDVTRKAFPFVNGYNAGLRETIGLDNISPAGDRANDCLPAARQLSNSLGLRSGSNYIITFKPFALTELPVDETAAEAYVRRDGVRQGGQREVSLVLDLELKAEAPELINTGKGNAWKFAAEITKITVVDKSNWPIATLNP
jgi:hypothetical protein